MKIINWFKKLMEIVADYDKKIEQQKKQNKTYRRLISEAVRLIQDRTDISVGAAFNKHMHNQIIVTGRYKNRDYVEVFTIAHGELEHLIHQLREMQRYGVVNKIDAPIGMRAVIDREIRW